MNCKNVLLHSQVSFLGLLCKIVYTSFGGQQNKLSFLGYAMFIIYANLFLLLTSEQGRIYTNIKHTSSHLGYAGSGAMNFAQYMELCAGALLHVLKLQELRITSVFILEV